MFSLAPVCPIFLGARYLGARLHAPIQTKPPVGVLFLPLWGMGQTASPLSWELWVVDVCGGCPCRASFVTWSCQCMGGGAPCSPVSGCSQASYPDVWFICAPSDHWGCPHAVTAAVCCWHCIGPLEKGQRVFPLGPGSQPVIAVTYGPGPSRGGGGRSDHRSLSWLELS